MDPLPYAFWSLLCASLTLTGFYAGRARGYRHGFEDGVECAESELADEFEMTDHE